MKRYSFVFCLFLIFAFAAAAQAQSISGLADDTAVETSTSSDKTLPVGFKSDKCTLWFDANYGDCCVEHDLAYWNWYKTGGWRNRLRADNRLFSCIAGKGFLQKGLAPFMWVGVRVFGSPLFPAQKGNFVHSGAKKLIRLFRKPKKDRARDSAAKKKDSRPPIN